MGDIRSKRCVFLSHCILAQCVRANGLAKYFAGPVKPVVQFCLDNDINMMQMPCPESLCAAGGLGRDPHGKKWYEDNGLRETARKIAHGQMEYIRALIKEGYQILAIIGMDFSPACAVNYLNKGPVIYKDRGIYIEELQSLIQAEGLEIRFIGVNQRALKKLSEELKSLNSTEEKMPLNRSTRDQETENSFGQQPLDFGGEL